MLFNWFRSASSKEKGEENKGVGHESDDYEELLSRLISSALLDDREPDELDTLVSEMIELGFMDDQELDESYDEHAVLREAILNECGDDLSLAIKKTRKGVADLKTKSPSLPNGMEPK